jgi:hypothetical protein
MRTGVFMLYLQATVVLEVILLECVFIHNESSMFYFMQVCLSFSLVVYFSLLCSVIVLPFQKHPGDKSCRKIFV